MNYMKNQEIVLIQKLSETVGEFIRYWGFRKIHGEIWTVVFLSTTPLSGAELVKVLKVSKALISPALKELEDEGLIVQVESENSKTKRYAAVPEVSQVIRSVLIRREQVMLSEAEKRCQDLVDKTEHSASINKQRLDQLARMIQMAQGGLAYLVASEEMWN